MGYSYKNKYNFKLFGVLSSLSVLIFVIFLYSCKVLVKMTKTQIEEDASYCNKTCTKNIGLFLQPDTFKIAVLIIGLGIFST